MDCPQPAVLEAAARGELGPLPPEIEQHLDGCQACLARLVEASAGISEQPDDAAFAETGRELPEMPGHRYEFVGELGRGGQSRVLRAYDRLLRRDVAFKQFVPRSSAPDSDAIARERFIREVGIMADLNHPGVIPILDLGVRDGWPYCTMQVVEGQTLTAARRELGDDPAGLDRLLSHFVSVCETVEFAHRLGVVHRDLKPDNVMLGRFGETHVLDWALAKRASDDRSSDDARDADPPNSDPVQTQAGTAVGTPAYMSPEHLDGATQAQPQSDIWSLGAVLFFVWTGHPPLEDDTVTGVISRVRSAHRDGLPAAALDRLPRELRALVTRAMSPLRDDRYPSAGAIARDVEALRTDRPVSVVQYSWWDRLARAVRHRPALFIASVVVAIVTAVGLTITWSALQRESAAHAEAASALDAERRARAQADELFEQEQRQAARVRAGLVEARANRAGELRRKRRVLRSRAFAAGALTLAVGLKRARLDPDSQRAVSTAVARARGELLVAQRDIVVDAATARPVTADRVRFVAQGGESYAILDAPPRLDLRHIDDDSVVRSYETDARAFNAIAISPSGTRVAAVTIADSGDTEILSWRTDGVAELRVRVPVKEDGLLAVSDSGVVAANAPDDAVFTVAPGRERPTEVAKLPNWALALSDDGTRLAISGNDGALRVVDATTGEVVLPCKTHPERLTALAMDAGGRRVVAGCVSGHVVVCSDDSEQVITAHRSRTVALDVSNDGRLVVSGDLDRTVAISDLDIGAVVAVFDGPTNAIYEVAFDDKRGRLHAFGREEIYTWEVDPARLRAVRPVAHHVRGGVQFDGTEFLLPHGLEPRIIAANAQTGAARSYPLGDAAPPRHIHVRTSGEVLTTDTTGTVNRWQRDEQGFTLRGSFAGQGKDLNAAAFSREHAVLEHKPTHGFTVWSLDDGRLVATAKGHDRPVFSLGVSPDGQHVVSGGADGRVMIWATADAALVATVQESGAPVMGVAFDTQGGVLAASDEGLTRWPAPWTGESQPLDEHRGYRHVAANPIRARVAASQTAESRIVVWDVATGQPVVDLIATIGVQNLAFSRDGQRLFWLSGQRMEAVSIPDGSAISELDSQAEAAANVTRSERVVLLGSDGDEPR